MKFRKKGDLKSHVICFHEPNSDKPQKESTDFTLISILKKHIKMALIFKECAKTRY